jgi:hypothetical protein
MVRRRTRKTVLYNTSPGIQSFVVLRRGADHRQVQHCEERHLERTNVTVIPLRAGHAASAPALIARLPNVRATVGVLPPLSPKGPNASWAGVTTVAPGQVLSVDRLSPLTKIAPPPENEQFVIAEGAARIVLLKVSVEPGPPA